MSRFKVISYDQSKELESEESEDSDKSDESDELIKNVSEPEIKKKIKKSNEKLSLDPNKICQNISNFMDEFRKNTEDTENDESEHKTCKTYKTLPWIERFRPQTLNDIVSHENIIISLKNMIKNKQLPHLLFCGQSGTGKTSTIIACAKDLYGDNNYDMMVLEINASEERGIDVIRGKVKDFILTKGVFLKENSCLFKLVILDEADAMTSDAQAMLRSVIEKYTVNVRFCLICNHIKKINPAIQSRCTVFKFSPLKQVDIVKKINAISKEMNVKINKSGIDMIVKIAKGDMRKVLNILQTTQMAYDTINADNVATCMAYPTESDIKNIFTMLMNSDFNTCNKKIGEIISRNGYSLLDVVTELTDIILKKFQEKKLDQKYVIDILIQLREIEMNLITCPNISIQLSGIVGLFISVLNSV